MPLMLVSIYSAVGVTISWLQLYGHMAREAAAPSAQDKIKAS